MKAKTRAIFIGESLHIGWNKSQIGGRRESQKALEERIRHFCVCEREKTKRNLSETVSEREIHFILGCLLLQITIPLFCFAQNPSFRCCCCSDRSGRTLAKQATNGFGVRATDGGALHSRHTRRPRFLRLPQRTRR